MDSELRQAHRRKPIRVELEEGQVLEAAPLQWQKRNDFGNAIVKAYSDSINEAVKVYVEEGSEVPQLEAKFYEKFQDPIKLLGLAYPGVPAKDYGKCSWHQLVELLLAALEVNDLMHLARMIDPNFQAPTENGGKPTTDGELESLLGPKIESLVGSSSPDSPETPSST